MVQTKAINQADRERQGLEARIEEQADQAGRLEAHLKDAIADRADYE